MNRIIKNSHLVRSIREKMHGPISIAKYPISKRWEQASLDIEMWA